MLNKALVIWFYGAVAVGVVRVSTALVIGRGLGREILVSFIGIAIPCTIFFFIMIMKHHRAAMEAARKAGEEYDKRVVKGNLDDCG